MSCNAWMGCTLTVHGHENDEAAIEWRDAAQISKDTHGNMTLFFEWESAGWFYDALEMLEADLRSLPLPLDAWSAHVRYEYYDEPSTDGSFCEFDVIDGKMDNFKESRIEMVEVTPWVILDMMEEEA